MYTYKRTASVLPLINVKFKGKYERKVKIIFGL